MWTSLTGRNQGKYEHKLGHKPKDKPGQKYEKKCELWSGLLPVGGKEKQWLIGKSIFIVLLFDYFFYRSIWFLLPLLGVGYWYYQMEKRALLEKKREEAREQFKELMLLAATGQKAGYSAENAFLSSYQDMKALFGKDSCVCRMISILKSGRENNIAFSTLWQKIGNELEIEEINEFAQVYEISQKSSGNMASIMEKTADVIVHKLETEKEIAVLLSAKRLEQRIMNVMPFLILFYINMASPGYFDGMYHSLPGALFMSICLFIYLGAYAISASIISIKI